MLKLHPIKEVIFHFLGFPEVIFLHPFPLFPLDFYSTIEIYKGEITKGLVGNDYVTFYDFKIFKNGKIKETPTKE